MNGTCECCARNGQLFYAITTPTFDEDDKQENGQPAMKGANYKRLCIHCAQMPFLDLMDKTR